MDEADPRVHGTTHAEPRARFEREERTALRALADVKPHHLRVVERRVANDALVDVDTVRYSVPFRLVRDHVEVWSTSTRCAYSAAATRSRGTCGRSNRTRASSTPSTTAECATCRRGVRGRAAGRAARPWPGRLRRHQPSPHQRLVRELATSRFVASAENLLFGAPGVGNTHLAKAFGRAAVEHGHPVVFVTASTLLAALARAELDGQVADKLAFFIKPKLLVIRSAMAGGERGRAGEGNCGFIDRGSSPLPACGARRWGAQDERQEGDAALRDASRASRREAALPFETRGFTRRRGRRGRRGPPRSRRRTCGARRRRADPAARSAS